MDAVDRGTQSVSKFANAGLAFASLLMIFQYLFSGQEIPENALLHPALLYLLAFVAALQSFYRRSIGILSFDSLRDSLPLLAFCAAAYLSGVRETWLLILFVLALIYNSFCLYAARSS